MEQLALTPLEYEFHPEWIQVEVHDRETNLQEVVMVSKAEFEQHLKDYDKIGNIEIQNQYHDCYTMTVSFADYMEFSAEYTVLEDLTDFINQKNK